MKPKANFGKRIVKKDGVASIVTVSAADQEFLKKTQEQKMLICVGYDYVTPVGPIPNAIGELQRFLEFIKSRHQSATELAFSKDPVIWDKFFGSKHEYGAFLYNADILRQEIFKKYIIHKELSTFFIKSFLRDLKSNAKYIYPLSYTVGNDKHLTGIDETQPTIDWSLPFFKKMSSVAVDDLQNGRCLVWIEQITENYIHNDLFYQLTKIAKALDLPKNSIVITLNCLHKYKDPEDRVKIISLPFFFLEYTQLINQLSHYKAITFTATGKDAEIFTNPRNHYFTFKIHRARTHRCAILFTLLKKGLLHLGQWSFLEKEWPDSRIIELQKDILIRFGVEISIGKIKEITNKAPHLLPGEKDHIVVSKNKDINGNDFLFDKILDFYYDSYFYICTESFYKYGATSDDVTIPKGIESFSEKICKPLANHLPFIFYSVPGALASLKKLGFKTFHPHIDESYDSELDNKKRFNMVMVEIIKLCSMSKEEIHNWYKDLVPLVIYNREWLRNFEKNTDYLAKALREVKHVTTGNDEDNKSK